LRSIETKVPFGFIPCHLFCQIWQHVRHWLGVYSVDPFNIVDHFYQFDTSSGFANSKRSLIQLNWFASSWVIWKERNDRLFPSQENSPAQLLKNIMLLSFWWFKAKFVVFPYTFHN
jgi:hypothetical protein